MRILFWSGTFWPKIGGVEVLAARLLPALQERGHEFMVITPRTSPDQDHESEFMGIPVYRFDFNNPAVFTDMKQLRVTRARIVELKRAHCPNLVHMNALDVGAFFHLITDREYPAPMLVTLHGGWGELPAVRESLISQTLRQAGWVVGCSNAILNRGKEFAPQIDSRSSVVYNGIEPPRLAAQPLPSDPPVLLCLGRTVAEKGVDIALQAFSTVEERMPGTRLLIVGDGEDRLALERQAAELGSWRSGVSRLGAATCGSGVSQSGDGRVNAIETRFISANRARGVHDAASVNSKPGWRAPGNHNRWKNGSAGRSRATQSPG